MWKSCTFGSWDNDLSKLDYNANGQEPIRTRFCVCSRSPSRCRFPLEGKEGNVTRSRLRTKGRLRIHQLSMSGHIRRHVRHPRQGAVGKHCMFLRVGHCSHRQGVGALMRSFCRHGGAWLVSCLEATSRSLPSTLHGFGFPKASFKFQVS